MQEKYEIKSTKIDLQYSSIMLHPLQCFCIFFWGFYLAIIIISNIKASCYV